MTRTFQLWRASEKKPHAQKTSMGHPASRFQASPISNRHLIHCAELDADLTCTKQTAGHVSNRQFFAFLKLPDTAIAGQSSGRRGLCRAPGKSRSLTNIRQERATGFGMTRKGTGYDRSTTPDAGQARRDNSDRALHRQSKGGRDARVARAQQAAPLQRQRRGRGQWEAEAREADAHAHKTSMGHRKGSAHNRKPRALDR